MVLGRGSVATSAVPGTVSLAGPAQACPGLSSQGISRWGTPLIGVSGTGPGASHFERPTPTKEGAGRLPSI